MSQPRITIFTCSFNKPQYVPDAISSVLQQTYGNFEYIILENSTDDKTRDRIRSIHDNRITYIEIDMNEEIRKLAYPESYVKNTFSPQARGQYIMYLADDDILEPTCFEEHITEFEKNKDQSINFHGWKVVYMDTTKPEEIFEAQRQYGLNTGLVKPANKVDGGSVMFKKELIAEVIKRSGKLFSMKWPDAHVSDGLFLNKLGQMATFYPIPKILHIKRITKISTHMFIDRDGNVASFRPSGYEVPTSTFMNREVI